MRTAGACLLIPRCSSFIRLNLKNNGMTHIDYVKSKLFWDTRAAALGKKESILITTLQDDIPAISDYRDKTEKAHFFRIVPLHKEMRVLDLGGGAGRWAAALAPYVAHVTVVDFSAEIIDIAKDVLREKGCTNISFIRCPVDAFQSDEKFDIILLSGILMYVNDADLDLIMLHCCDMLTDKGKVVLREGINLKGKVVQADTYVSELGTRYNVIWRHPQEYIDLFEKKCKLTYWADAFPFLVPVFLYKRLLPESIRRRKPAQRLLRSFLFLQSHAFYPFLFC